MTKDEAYHTKKGCKAEDIGFSKLQVQNLGKPEGKLIKVKYKHHCNDRK